MNMLRRFLSRLGVSRSGVALIEFAFVSPFLILLVLGSVELTRYVLIVQKVDKAVYALGDVLAQSIPATNPTTPGELDAFRLNGIFALYANLMEPFADASRQVVIAASVQRVAPDNIVRWQAAGGGTLTGAEVLSVVNGLGPAAISPAATHNTNVSASGATTMRMSQMLPNENMVVTEVFYRYEPFLAEVLEGFGFEIEPAILSRRIFMRPRNGELIHLPPSVPVP